jgi:DNA-binding NarL/FixJ family response regulator
MEALDLFSAAALSEPRIYNSAAPFVKGSATSLRAAESIEPVRMTQREKVRLFVMASGAVGATRKEIAFALGMSENSVRPRVKELLSMRAVMVSGQPPRDGCEVLVPFAREGA